MVWREGGGEERGARGGGGAMGEEERVIVSLSLSLSLGAGFVGRRVFCVRVFRLAVGGGVVGLLGCAGWAPRIKPPSVRDGRELGSGLVDGRVVGEVVSAGGVGSEC